MNLHRKLTGQVPMVYCWSGAAAIIAGVIGAGASVYSSNKQMEAQEEAQQRADYAAMEAEREQQRIFEATKPEEEEAKISFGTQDDDDELGTYNEFLAPKSTSKPTLGSNSSLGFGTLGGVA